MTVPQARDAILTAARRMAPDVSESAIIRTLRLPAIRL